MPRFVRCNYWGWHHYVELFHNTKGEMMTTILVTKSSDNEVICEVMVKFGDL
jgi:hypothetical protein